MLKRGANNLELIQVTLTGNLRSPRDQRRRDKHPAEKNSGRTFCSLYLMECLVYKTGFFSEVPRVSQELMNRSYGKKGLQLHIRKDSPTTGTPKIFRTSYLMW